MIPEGVHLLDEIPPTVGVVRYPMGDFFGMLDAIERCLQSRNEVDRAALRALTDRQTPEELCRQHLEAFEELMTRERGER